MNIRSLFSRKAKRTGAQLPEFLPILEELAREWNAVTDQDVDRYERILKPPADGDTKLGVVHSLEARRMMALAGIMATRCGEARLHAQGRAADEHEAEYYREMAGRFDALDDCCRNLFWAQAKDDIGVKAWTAPSVGLRSGWMLVARKPPQVPAFMRQMFSDNPPE